MYDVLCTGLSSCDLIFSKLRKWPELGKEMVCDDFLIKPGGGANTPLALSKLGLKTAFATSIGRDIPGKIVYEYLERSGLDLSASIYAENYRTSVSAVLSIGKERGFATYFAHEDKEKLFNGIVECIPYSRHVHVYLDNCMEMPIVEEIKKQGKTISIDTGWNENIKLHHVKQILQQCDIFFTNEIEACSIAEHDSAEKAAEILNEYAKLVVVKLGERGSIIKLEGNTIRIPPTKVSEVVDTTGAGDLYAAGFIYGYLNGWGVEKTGKLASASGGLAVTFCGGTDDSYTYERVMELYDTFV